MDEEIGQDWPAACESRSAARLEQVIADLGRCRGELDSLGLHAPAAHVDLAIYRCRDGRARRYPIGSASS